MMPHGDIEDHSFTESNRKTACFRCRGFRHACDRKKPSCTTCHARGLECVYPEAAMTLKNLQTLAAKLSARVQELKKFSKADGFAECVRTRQSRLIKHYALYPCQKCNQLQQPCDMRKPHCDRCKSHDINCVYIYNEKPKVYHISHAITAMNRVLNAYESTLQQVCLQSTSPTLFPLATRKPIWTVTSTPQGFTAYAHVSSYNELQMLINHIHENQPMEEHISQHPGAPTTTRQHVTIPKSDNNSNNNKATATAAAAGLPDYPFAVWDAWTYSTKDFPHNYPIEVTPQMTDDLLTLYSLTPCCSASRLPIIDTKEFMARYRSPDVEKQPSKVLIYAICAMTARNAFQVHVWCKRPAHESPHYNMGKALSLAYWLAARKLLAECFDEPSLDTCRAALLLSYCSHQNGYTATMHFYDWITITMAKELGLFDEYQTNYYDRMLAWTLYYWDVCVRVLGAGVAYVSCPKPSFPPPSPPVDRNDESYDVLSTWSFRFNLQLQQDTIMSCIILAQEQGLSLPEKAKLFQPLQAQLETFFQELPEEWRRPQTKKYQEEQKHKDDCQETTTIDRDMLRRECMAEVMVSYFITLIMVHYPLLPTTPSTMTTVSEVNSYSPHARRCFEICMHAAQSITCVIETVADCCSIPVIGLVFSNGVYHKIFQYTGSKWALQRIEQSIDILKLSFQYVYDFDLTKTLVQIMENEVQVAMSTSQHNFHKE